MTASLGLSTPSRCPVSPFRPTRLRPRNLDEYVGQARAVENLRVYIRAAKAAVRPWTTSSVGSTGTGQDVAGSHHRGRAGSRSSAHLGAVIEQGGDLAAILNSLGPREVLFIDEVTA